METLRRPPSFEVLAAFVLAALVLAAPVVLGGCVGGFAPQGRPAATDIGALGCQIAPAPGATVRGGEPLAPGEPMAGVNVKAMTPRQVGELARLRGLKVTWRYQYFVEGSPGPDGGRLGANECWCQPPPEGRVIDVAYGGASELVVFVDSNLTWPALRTQPPRGWGC